MDRRLDLPRWQPALLALLVHLAFFALLALGVSWQSREPAPVSAELWADVPPAPRPAPTSVPAAPAQETESAHTPKPQVPPDIAIEAEKKKAKPAPQKRARREPDKPVPKAMPDKPPAPSPATPSQEDVLAERLAAIHRQVGQRPVREGTPAANPHKASEIAEYKSQIERKIRGYLNRQPCGSGNPELEFEVALLPTGQLYGPPILRKSSGLAACDRAVETAILSAEPLPVPRDPELFADFRQLQLKFRPNDAKD